MNDQNSLPDAWTRARDLIIDSKDISDEERLLLQTGSLKKVIQDLADLEHKHEKESHFRRFATKIRLKPLLDGLTNLDQIINPITQIDPFNIAPLVWGGLRVVLSVIFTSSPIFFFNELPGHQSTSQISRRSH